jgi:hypothetical protein
VSGSVPAGGAGRAVIVGAAGRDLRDHPNSGVVAFTAAQTPDIAAGSTR